VNGKHTDSLVPILMYHKLDASLRTQVGWQQRLRNPSVLSIKDFDSQMSYLQSQGYRSISLNDFIAYMRGKDTLPGKSIIITFDDGDASHYSMAYPILLKYGLKGTFFVITDAIDSPGSLSLTQMKEMLRNGMAIESHSVTHRLLPSLPKQELMRELRESRKILEEKLGKAVDFFAVPGGIYNSEVITMARKVGYLGMVTSKLGMNDITSDEYCLMRIEVRLGTSLRDFVNLIEGRRLWLKQLRQSMVNAVKKTLRVNNYERIKKGLLRLSER